MNRKSKNLAVLAWWAEAVASQPERRRGRKGRALIGDHRVEGLSIFMDEIGQAPVHSKTSSFGRVIKCYNKAKVLLKQREWKVMVCGW